MLEIRTPLLDVTYYLHISILILGGTWISHETPCLIFHIKSRLRNVASPAEKKKGKKVKLNM